MRVSGRHHRSRHWGITMLKLLGLGGCGLGLAALLLGSAPALAQRCTVDCGSGQIQFTPGDRITVQITNRSRTSVAVEQTPMTGTRTLRPGDTTEMGFGWGTTPNIFLLFWALQDHPIRATLGRPSAQTLAVEIYSAPSEPSDRSIVIENDGRVTLK